MSKMADRLASKVNQSHPTDDKNSLLDGLDGRRQRSSNPRSAPGQVMAFSEISQNLREELEIAKKDAAQFKDALPVRALDPRSIRPSVYANRIERNFLTQDFEELKSSIAEMGKNVQPIKVRMLNGNDGAHQFEIVYGHRRHRACLELGLPVHAMVAVDLSDRDLFREMDKENASRINLSAYEYGLMYLNALERGLYPSQYKLAEELGKHRSVISRSIHCAQLPREILDAYDNVLDIAQNVGAMLYKAHEKTPDVIIERAKKIRDREASLKANQKASAAQITHELLNGIKPAALQSTSRQMIANNKVFGVFKVLSDGGFIFQIKPGLSKKELPSVLENIQESLKQTLK